MQIDPSEVANVADRCRDALRKGQVVLLMLDRIRLNNLGLSTRDLYRTIEDGRIDPKPQLYPDGNLEWIFRDVEELAVSVVDDKRNHRAIITNFWKQD